MSKLAKLLEQQKKLMAEIEAAKQEEAIQHEKSYVALYKSLKLDQFTIDEIKTALMTVKSVVKTSVKNTEDKGN